eukprot:6017562-Pleurochrysis_carterae.AAC.1
MGDGAGSMGDGQARPREGAGRGGGEGGDTANADSGVENRAEAVGAVPNQLNAQAAEAEAAKAAEATQRAPEVEAAAEAEADAEAITVAAAEAGSRTDGVVALALGSFRWWLKPMDLERLADLMQELFKDLQTLDRQLERGARP